MKDNINHQTHPAGAEALSDDLLEDVGGGVGPTTLVMKNSGRRHQSANGLVYRGNTPQTSDLVQRGNPSQAGTLLFRGGAFSNRTEEETELITI